MKYLNLETIGSSATSGLLEFPALGDEAGLDTIVGVGVVDGGAVTEMPDGLTGALGATEEDSVGALGGADGELVEGDALTTSCLDASTCALGEAKGCNSKGRNLQHTLIIRDTTNNYCSLSVLILHVAG